MKSIFNEDGLTYSKDAVQFDLELYQALMPLFKSWIDRGYSIRELSHIASLSVLDAECTLVLDIRSPKKE